MLPLGYDRFPNFEPAIERAILAIEVSGIDAGRHIEPTTKSYAAGFGMKAITDYKLTRYGAYHVALSVGCPVLRWRCPAWTLTRGLSST